MVNLKCKIAGREGYWTGTVAKQNEPHGEGILKFNDSKVYNP